MPAVHCTRCNRLLMVSHPESEATPEILCTPCESLPPERRAIRKASTYELPARFTYAADDRSS